MFSRWSRPPPIDESGRLAPEVRAQARRRVLRSLASLVVIAIIAGLLAYGCDRLGKNTRGAGCCGGRSVPAVSGTVTATPATASASCHPCSSSGG